MSDGTVDPVVEARTLLPLDVLLKVMREKWALGDRIAAANIAKIAAPYLHARATTTPARSPASMTDEELALWIDGDDA